MAPLRGWEQLGAWAGLLVAPILVIDLVTLSSSPSITASAEDIARHLRGNTTMSLVMSYLGALSAVLLLWFLASMRAFEEDSNDDAEWRWSVTLLSGTVASSALLVGSAVRASAAILADNGASLAAVTALFATAKVTLSFALVPIAAVVLANAGTIASSESRPRWLARFGTQIGAVSMLSSLAVFFTRNNWFGPGEPVVTVTGVLLSMWLVSVAVTLLFGET